MFLPADVVGGNLCPICSTYFKQEDELSFHITLHEGKDPLQCYACDELFTKKNEMTFHVGSSIKGF